MAPRDGLPGSIPLYYAGFAIGRIGTFAALPVISRLLGAEGFGQFEVYVAVLLMASVVFDAGVGASIVRFFEDGRFSRGQLLRAAAYVQGGASFVAVAIVGSAVTVLVSSDVLLAALAVVILFAVVEGFAVIGGALLRVQGRDRLFFGLSLSRFAIVALVGPLGATVGPAWALLGISLGGLGFAVFAAASIAGRSTADAAPATIAFARYGFPLVATTAMTWCLSVSDRLFLNSYVSSAEIGEYGANYRLGSVVTVFLAGPLVLAWVPTIRRAAGESERIEMCSRWSGWFAIASLGCLVLVVALAPKGVPVIFGSEFEENSLVIVAAGLGGWLLGLAFLIATPILLGDRTAMLAVVATVVSAFNLGLNSVLIPLYGVPGAAIATVGSYTFLCLGMVVAAGVSTTAAWFTRWRHFSLIASLLGSVALAATVSWAGLAAMIVSTLVLRPSIRHQSTGMTSADEESR